MIAFLQFVISYKKNNKSTIYLNRIDVNGLLLRTFLSFLSLIYSYLVSDFSLANVFKIRTYSVKYVKIY